MHGTTYDPNDVQQLTSGINLLQALHDPSRSDHSLAIETLERAVSTGQISFALVMTQVFAQGASYGVGAHLRQLSGLLIKNFCLVLLVNQSEPISPQFQQALLLSICDEQLDIRRTAGSIVGKICRSCDNFCWFSLFLLIMQRVEKQSNDLDFATLDGCVYALRLICEDVCDIIARAPDLCLEKLMNRLIIILGCSHSSVRLSSLLAINALLPLLEHCYSVDEEPAFERPKRMQQSQGVRTVYEGACALSYCIPALLSALSSMAADPLPDIRRAVCSALVALAMGSLQFFADGLPSVCNFMEGAVSDAAEEVAKEAIEFWLTLADSEDDLAFEALHKHVVPLTHICVLRLRITRAQLQSDREEQDAQASGEKRVFFYKRGRADDDDESDIKYTVRKRAALLLDRLALKFPKETTATAIPLIQERLEVTENMLRTNPLPDIDVTMNIADNASLLRESAMLALGALASGAHLLLEPALPRLYPLLLSGLADSLPETRAIACWTLTRLHDWVTADVRDPSMKASTRGRSHCLLLLQGLLASMRDPLPYVQQAACTALTRLFSECEPSLLLGEGHQQSILVQITQHLGQAFASYGVKNRILLLDLIRSLAQALGQDFCSEETGGAAEIPRWLPCVLTLFSDEDDADEGDVTFSVAAECLAAVVGVLGHTLYHYASGIFTRCAHMARRDLQRFVEAEALMKAEGHHVAGGTVVTNLNQFTELENSSMREWDLPVKDNITGALELLSALLEALGPEGASGLNVPALSPSWDSALAVALHCARDADEPSCRQAALSFLGEVTRATPALLSDGDRLATALSAVEEGMALFIDCEQGEREAGMMAFNNVCWLLGLLAIATSPHSAVGGLGRMDERSILQNRLSRLLFPLVTAFRTLSKMQGTDAELTFLNLAICVGRLGMIFPTQVATVLPEIIDRLLSAMLLLDIAVEHDSEFGHTWLGLLSLLEAAPRALLSSKRAGGAFVSLCAAHVSLESKQQRMEQFTAGTQTWMAAPSLIVSDSQIKSRISSVLQALQREQPSAFATLTSPRLTKLAAFS